MPRRSNPFQRLVKGIEAGLAGTGVSVTESAMVPDRVTGEEREVDVLLKGEIAGHPVVLAVEARDWETPQDVTWIDSLQGKKRDLPIDRLIAVSSSGFTDGAEKRAAKLGIETLTLEEALATDWPDEVLRLTAAFVGTEHKLTKAAAHYVGEGPGIEGKVLKGCQILDGDGNLEGTFAEVALRLYQEDGVKAVQEEFGDNLEKYGSEEPGTERRLEIRYQAHDQHLVDPEGDSHQLEAISIAIQWTHVVHPSDTTHYNYKDAYVTEAKLEHPSLGEHSLVIVQPPDEAGQKASIHYQSQPASSETQERDS